MAAPVSESSRSCSESEANRLGTPWPQNDWSLDRLMRLYSSVLPVVSSRTCLPKPNVSAIVGASSSTDAPLAPTESTLTWQTQRSCRSCQWLSAYQVELA